VAEFGGADAGSVFWLRTMALEYSSGNSCCKASGALNVSPMDVDGDGRQDLVSLIAQEHESVVAFLNSGGGEFRKVVLASAPHPMYGSTSMSVVDLDQDHDDDILFTNGDAFDAQTDPKPITACNGCGMKARASSASMTSDVSTAPPMRSRATWMAMATSTSWRVVGSTTGTSPAALHCSGTRTPARRFLSRIPSAIDLRAFVTLELIDMTGDGVARHRGRRVQDGLADCEDGPGLSGGATLSE
jgi:hypothetical protein